MKIVGILIVVLVFCLIAAWGIRQDRKRRQKRQMLIFASNMMKLSESFMVLIEPTKKAAEAIQKFGEAFRKINDDPVFYLPKGTKLSWHSNETKEDNA